MQNQEDGGRKASISFWNGLHQNAGLRPEFWPQSRIMKDRLHHFNKLYQKKETFSPLFLLFAQKGKAIFLHSANVVLLENFSRR
ncbi:MAG: hypothetical protein SPJ28_03210 [Oscillospiraceae bacterium]|nr:hypothetical protein [Oscillospiraceae bacterium]